MTWWGAAMIVFGVAGMGAAVALGADPRAGDAWRGIAPFFKPPAEFAGDAVLRIMPSYRSNPVRKARMAQHRVRPLLVAALVMASSAPAAAVGGARRQFKAPFSGDAVLYLAHPKRGT